MATFYECDSCHNAFEKKLTPVNIGKDHYELCEACATELKRRISWLLRPKFNYNERVVVLDYEGNITTTEGNIFKRIRFPENGDKFYHYDIILDDDSLLGDIPENKLRRASEVNL